MCDGDPLHLHPQLTSTALSGHTIEKIESARSAYLVRADPLPLPSINFTLETPQLYQRKAHAFINHSYTRS